MVMMFHSARLIVLHFYGVFKHFKNRTHRHDDDDDARRPQRHTLLDYTTNKTLNRESRGGGSAHARHISSL